MAQPARHGEQGPHAHARAAPGVRKWLGEEAAGANEVGCRILRNLLKNFRAPP